MQAILLMLWLLSFALMLDLFKTIIKCDIFNTRWAGFKVCKNGAIYNKQAKRFANKQEKQLLFCVTEI